MRPILRRLLRFSLAFFPLFVIFLVAFISLIHHYEPIVVGSANLITRRLNPPTHIVISETGKWIGYRFDPIDGMERIGSWNLATRQLILLSLVTLPSLLLATPTAWRQRVRWILIAIPLIYLGHVLAAAALSRGLHCLQQTPGLFLCRWASSLAATSGQMVAGTVWFVLTWRFWFEGESDGKGKGANVAHSGHETDTEPPADQTDTHGGMGR